MKLPRIFNIFRKKEANKKYDGFADFFLRASDAEKKEVLKEAAQGANKEQLDVFQKSQYYQGKVQ